MLRQALSRQALRSSYFSRASPVSNLRSLSQVTTPRNSYVHRYRRMTNNGPLVWVDCEMTGLDVFNDHIIEVCCLLTDKDLNIIENKGFEATIHYPKEVMDNMNEWCVKTHGKVCISPFTK